MDIIIRVIADGAVIPVMVLGAVALLWGVPRGQRLAAYQRVLMAGLTAYVGAKLLGAAYQPEIVRPFEALGVDPGAAYLNNPGFPSDHALFVAAITLAVWCETAWRRTALVLTVLTALVCIGRVLALVHTPLDVLAGVVIAGVAGLWYGAGRWPWRSRTQSARPPVC